MRVIVCRSAFIASTFFGVFAMAGPASAQVAYVGGTAAADEETAPETWRFTIGLGAAIVPDYVGVG